MLLLDFHPQVETDLAEGAEWYERQPARLGERFLVEAQGVLRRLLRDARLYSVRFEDICRVNLQSFSHGVFYFIAGETVVVLGIMHGHRDARRELESRRQRYG